MNIVMRFPEGKFKCLTFSYDDGGPGDERLCKTLNKYGLKGTFNLNSFKVNEKTNKNIYIPLGHEVAMHTYNHPMIAELPDAVAMEEILSDKKHLEQAFETIIVGGAYPFGSYSKKVEDMLKLSGVKYFRHVTATHRFDMPGNWLELFPTCHHADKELMNLAKDFVDIKKNENIWWEPRPKMFYVWGHTFEFDRDDNWQIIEEFAEFISGRDDVWYETNAEIYRYTEAFSRLEFSSCGTMVYNPTAQTIWFETGGKEYAIASGENMKI